MNKNSLMILFSAFLLVVIGGGLFLIVNKEGSGTAVKTDKISEPITVDFEEEVDENELAPKGWRTYSNADLKFSVNYPEKAFNFNGSCEKKVEGEITTYRPKVAEVPLKIFEDETGIFIAFEYEYKLTDPRSENSITYFDTCTKISTTLQGLNKDMKSWHIIAKPVLSREALEVFVKNNFGQGCSVDTMTSVTANSKIYDVRIVGDGKEPPETECFVNYRYVLKYVPEAKMAYTYNLGQAYSFSKAIDGSSAYDDEMTESFVPIF